MGLDSPLCWKLWLPRQYSDDWYCGRPAIRRVTCPGHCPLGVLGLGGRSSVPGLTSVYALTRIQTHTHTHTHSETSAAPLHGCGSMEHRPLVWSFPFVPTQLQPQNQETEIIGNHSNGFQCFIGRPNCRKWRKSSVVKKPRPGQLCRPDQRYQRWCPPREK